MRHSPVVPKSVTVPMPGYMKPKPVNPDTAKSGTSTQSITNTFFIFLNFDYGLCAAKLTHPSGIGR